jgi:hypothetical protein
MTDRGLPAAWERSLSGDALGCEHEERKANRSARWFSFGPTACASSAPQFGAPAPPAPEVFSKYRRRGQLERVGDPDGAPSMSFCKEKVAKHRRRAEGTAFKSCLRCCQVGGRTTMATVDQSSIRGSKPHERLSSQAYLGLSTGVGMRPASWGSRGLP